MAAFARAAVAVFALGVCVCNAAGLLTSAEAAVIHEYEPVLSEKISEGVPSGGGPVAGPLGAVNAMSVAAGKLWTAEQVEGQGSRVDAFGLPTGAFTPPQLPSTLGEGGLIGLDQGVAVGGSGGEERVYVGTAHSSGEGVVGVFDPTSGKLAHMWDGAATVNGSFTQEKGSKAGLLTGVAVDNSANLETVGDVYVSTAGFVPSFTAVDVLKPEPGGAEPAKATAELLGTCAKEGESCAGEEVPFTEPRGVAVSGFNAQVLVIDKLAAVHSVIDVFEPGLLGEYKFVRQLTGTPTGAGGAEVPFGRIAAVAVDGKDGDIYVADQSGSVVDELSAEGQLIVQLAGIPGRPFGEVQSVAVDPESEDVFVGEVRGQPKHGVVDAFGPNSIVPDVTTSAPSAIEATQGAGQIEGVAEGQLKARLNGAVNPLNEGSATCAFAWGVGSLDQSASCEPPTVANGASPVSVHAEVESLAPDTKYTFRLQATNKNGTNSGEASQDKELHTPGPGILEQSASDVAASSATLGATIDPNGAPTSYFFQYGRGEGYEAATPAPTGAPLGSESGELQVTPAHIQGLLPSTRYHYRVVAVSTLSVNGTPTQLAFAGPDQSFTTQGAGEGFQLPDNREWELVSPPDKHGALLLPILEADVDQAAASGGAITYLATLPTEAQVKGYLYGGVQVLSSRSASGWTSQNITLPHGSASGTFPNEYWFFTPELTEALAEPRGEFTSLAPEVFPPDTETTPYVRHNATCAASPASCFEPLLTSAPGYEDLAEGVKFGGAHGSEAHFVGSSGDLSSAILSSTLALTGQATGGAEQLFEWSAGKPPAGRLQLVSVRPDGKVSGGGGALLGVGTIARHAVSEDGSRIAWSEEGGEAHLYLRDTSKSQTIELDAPQAGCLAAKECGEGSVSPHFQLASPDDSRILFTDQQALTADASKVPGAADLYECRVTEEAGSLGCQLTDLTPSPGNEKAADVQGAVVGASEDARQVYFVANGLLGDAAARGGSVGNCAVVSKIGTGMCNLYRSDEGQVWWIATLAGADFPDWGIPLAHQTARVSPNGRYLAFMSERPLSGYDNRDAVSGQPDEEVFEYDASSESLVCASCDPSGARPEGVEYAQINDQLVGGNAVWGPQTWIAANVPGWTPYQSPGLALYQSRYLSNSGRLFFNAHDALSAKDINANEDVYEYEPAGVGSCGPSSPAYLPAEGACVALVSSGRASGESAFLDASESGDDVFFLTSEALVRADHDTARDLYDAHVCSGEAPCFSETTPPPPCTTAESCRAAPSPQPDIFGQPPSATFEGEGNLVPAPAAKAVAKPTKAQQLAKALTNCRKRYARRKRRRKSCEATARKRYGAKQAAKKKSKKKSKGKRAHR